MTLNSKQLFLITIINFGLQLAYVVLPILNRTYKHVHVVLNYPQIENFYGTYHNAAITNVSSGN